MNREEAVSGRDMETRVLEFLEGEMTAAEEQAFLAEAEANAQLRTLLEEYRQQEKLLNGYFAVRAAEADRVKHPDLSALPTAKVVPARGGAMKYLAMAAAVALVAGGAAVLWPSQPQDEWGTVAYVSGPAKVVAEGKVTQVRDKESIKPGIERIKTAEKGALEIALAGGGSIELNENSTLRMTKQGAAPEMVLDRGEVFVRRAPATIRTPWFSAESSDAEFNVVRGLKGAELAVASGTVEVRANGERRTLDAGETWSSTNSRTMPVAQRVAWSRHTPSMEELTTPLPDSDVLAMANDEPAVRRVEASFAASTVQPAQYNLVQSTTSFLPSNTLGVIEIRSVITMLNKQGGTNDLSDALLGARLRDVIVGLVQSAEQDLVAREKAINDINEVFGNEELNLVLESLRGELTVGLTPTGPAVVAQVTDNYSAVERLINVELAEKFGPLEGNASRLRMQVVGGYLVAAFDQVSFNESTYAARTHAATAFGASPFVAELYAAAGPSAPIVAGSDIQGIFSQFTPSEQDRRFLEFTGFHNMKSIIASPGFADDANNRALQVRFDGPREGMMAWLAEPGPINGLEFFSPATHALVAARIEHPLRMLQQFALLEVESNGRDLAELEADENYLFLSEFAASLGNEVVMGLDNPVLPIPNVKFVIELEDPVAFHDGMLKFIETSQAHGAELQLIADTTTYRNHMIVEVHQPNSTIGLTYAVVDDHAVFGPGKPFLQAAIDTFVDRRSIDLEPKFIEALPDKSGSYVSSLLFVAHNESMQSATPLLSQLLASRGMPIDLEAIGRTVPNRSIVLYSIAEPDRIDWYLNGVDGEFQMTGILPSVTEWLAAPSSN